ncbi:hypothetical protein [Amycolatopsis sp. CA-126428]|uniref:hypothetical protein n=1 Tax=Amycolatopsis sp. CA-126428 TaxID=2073158 RepID=UPI0011B0C1AC|nr:hypothetical protein [Amycolatopsis sp. CA-126428]
MVLVALALVPMPGFVRACTPILGMPRPAARPAWQVVAIGAPQRRIARGFGRECIADVFVVDRLRGLLRRGGDRSPMISEVRE